jgi:hypothetical protein
MSALASHARAAEGSYFSAAQRELTLRRLERLVGEGRAPAAALAAARAADGAAEVVRPARGWQYVAGRVPPRAPLPRFGLGSSFSLGRSRWSSDSVSIFDVAEGKAMASAEAPAHFTSTYDQRRAARVAAAAMEAPTLAGLRVLPALTPGRAFLWGTILAVWGTAAAASTAAKRLEIGGAAEAGPRLRAAFEPVAAAMRARLAPLREGLEARGAAAAGLGAEGGAGARLATGIRSKLG